MTGQTIAHYRITAKLGQGGMGAVYRATDTKLDREVAIKVLPESFARDRERLARFEREAKVVASLNHPNIAGIFGLEQSGDSQALVLELVEGEDLSVRLKRGPLPVEEALDVCRQIAEALEAAHEKGIIHRDLKPGNVKLTEDGKVKVLDFGLAKTATAETSSVSPDSPTITADYTLPGTLLGTAGYMSPEQARGKAVDKRSDIWSFGVVLFECLTGKRLFPGETVTDSIGALLHKEIDWSQLPPNTPPTVQLLLRKCLARDRKRRLHDIGDARIDLEQSAADPSSSFIRLGEESLREVKAAPGLKHLRWVVGALAAISLVLAGIWLGERNRSQRLEGALTEATKRANEVENRFSRGRKIELIQRGLPGGESNILAAVISPDGRYLAFSTRSGLWIRHLEGSFEAVRIQGTDKNSRSPFWSPDSSELGYFVSRREIRKARLNGMTSELVTAIPKATLGRFLADRPADAAGGAWLDDGRIIYTVGSSGLYAVSAKGGESSAVLEVQEDEQDYHEVSPLPGGKGVAFVIHAKSGRIGAIATWNGKDPKRIVVESSDSVLRNPVYSPSGHLIYERGFNAFSGGKDTGLWAVRFDPSTLTSGDPFPVMEMAENPSVAGDGTLVYVPGAAGNSPFLRMRQLVWVGADGMLQEPIGNARRGFGRLALSSDGTRILALGRESVGAGSSRLWLYSADRGNAFPLKEAVMDAHWLPGDETIIATDLTGLGVGVLNPRIFRMSLNNPGSTETLLTNAALGSVSGNGRYVLARRLGGLPLTYTDLTLQDGTNWMALPIQPHESAYRMELSPDGRHLAYSSKETGNDEIFVVSFPGMQGKRMVSLNGGQGPKWSRDGRTLFFVKERSMMSVAVTVDPETGFGTVKESFKIPESITDLDSGRWDISSDGKRFLMLQNVPEGDAAKTGEPKAPADSNLLPSVFLIENWHRGFK